MTRVFTRLDAAALSRSGTYTATPNPTLGLGPATCESCTNVPAIALVGRCDAGPLETFTVTAPCPECAAASETRSGTCRSTAARRTRRMSPARAGTTSVATVPCGSWAVAQAADVGSWGHDRRPATPRRLGHFVHPSEPTTAIAAGDLTPRYSGRKPLVLRSDLGRSGGTASRRP